MFSYLIDVYFYQLRDLTGVNYGWILRRFIACFILGLLVGWFVRPALGGQEHSHSITHAHDNIPSHTHEITHTHTPPNDKAHQDNSPHAPHAYNDDQDKGDEPFAYAYVHKQAMLNKAHQGETPNVEPTVTDRTSVEPTDNSSDEQPASTDDMVAKPSTEYPAPTRQEATPEPEQSPLRITEYMVRDWTKWGGGGLPQWIELHNRNTESVNLKGWTFQYATRKFANHPYEIHTLTLAATEDGFSIPGGGVAILATQRLPARKFSGIEVTQVYSLDIKNVLKRGWVLTDADGKEIHRLGRDAFKALREPVAPRHQEGARVSYQVYRSESPSESYYYGNRKDIGSPGFYEEPVRAAPTLQKPKRITLWGQLKR